MSYWKVYILAFLILLGVISESDSAIRSTFTSAAVSVLHTASGLALAANNARNFLMLQNDHATQRIWCKFGATAVINDGFRVNPAGGTIILDNAVPVTLLNCIAETGTTILLVTEGRQ